jgi:hypothetical protein
MNWKKFFIAFIAAFVFVFVYEWVFHGIILKDSYAQMSALMRPQAEVNFPLLIVGQLVGAFFFTMIFVRGFGSGGGVAGGFRYGVLLGLFLCGGIIISYAVQPLTTTIAMAWCIGGIIELAIAGAIVGALYKPGASAA